jgi:hypothetical protein
MQNPQNTAEMYCSTCQMNLVRPEDFDKKKHFLKPQNTSSNEIVSSKNDNDNSKSSSLPSSSFDENRLRAAKNLTNLYARLVDQLEQATSSTTPVIIFVCILS